MAGAGVPPVIVIPQPFSAAFASLASGQQFSAVVQGTPGNLFIQVAGLRALLTTDTLLQLGQAVTVEVVTTDQGVQLQVTPQTQPPPSQSASPPAPPAAAVPQGAASTPTLPVPAVLASVLEALGALESAPAAAQLLPTNIPLTEEAVRQLVSMFLFRGTAGADLEQIQSILTQAVTQNAVPRGFAAEITAAIARLVVTDEASLSQILAHWGRGEPTGLEARLAFAVASGDLDHVLELLGQEVRALLSRVRQDPDLARFLEQTGQTRDFHGAVGRVLDRLSGRQLQNLHSIDRSYQFLELPVATDSPYRHLQLHFFGHGQSGRKRFDPQNATVVLDVSMSRLGDLWINLAVANGRCTCTIRATNPETVDTIESDGDELRHALDGVGYPGAQIRVGLWDGDRFAAATKLIRQFTGFHADA